MNRIKLKLKGREFDFTFGLGFLGELLDVLDISIDEVVGKLNRNPFKMIPFLMYRSAKYSFELEGKDFDYTILDFITWIEEEGGFTSKSVESFLVAFTNSMTKGVPVEEEITDEPKKK